MGNASPNSEVVVGFAFFLLTGQLNKYSPLTLLLPLLPSFPKKSVMAQQPVLIYHFAEMLFYFFLANDIFV
jgi:hypothetical protein